MSFALDAVSVLTLKSEAKALREERSAAGAPITHAAALEEVAHAHGYRDWNTARAALPERFATPAQIGERVHGTYLGRPFAGVVMGMQVLADMAHFTVTVKFDEPVVVTRSTLFEHKRQRVVATVDVYGISMSRTSDGEPHMRLKRG